MLCLVERVNFVVEDAKGPPRPHGNRQNFTVPPAGGCCRLPSMSGCASDSAVQAILPYHLFSPSLTRDCSVDDADLLDFLDPVRGADRHAQGWDCDGLAKKLARWVKHSPRLFHQLEATLASAARSK
jgi:hypothetical protein